MLPRSSNEQYCKTLTSNNLGPSQILPFLFNNHITHVINVSKTGDRTSFLNKNDDEHFLRIPIDDSLKAQLLPYFDQAYAFIEKARSNNGCVLIHCLAGISRSPTLAIAYIIRYLHLSADDAYKYVKQRRSQISPNFNFLGQLHEYEQNLISTSTITPIVKCTSIKSPVNNRRHCIQVESCSQTATSLNYHTNTLKRPMYFNIDSINTRRPQTLLDPSSMVTQLPDESSHRPSLVKPISLYLNNLPVTHSGVTDECSTVQLINSSYDESKNRKRNEKISKNTDRSSSFIEQSDLINSYFEESRLLSKSLEQCKSTQSFDSDTETLKNNLTSSSLEVLVL
ncbi:unnamed protein product [Adineta steineri]|uniref:protein-tyrosine-phosphatase n=1 Tax=Adineta steineri TaxID=433720 RepID=A0A814A6L1_9BILA|nr:unnamed protein product [Adineta steineri]CAF0909642.1 unnamed protein product [Adineta steineri]